MGDGSEARWDPPGPGPWFFSREHFPRPVSQLFATLFPPAPTLGWRESARRYGMPSREANWAAVNSWLYYSPGGGVVDDATEAAATETLQTERWAHDIRHWYEVDRPRVIDANRSLQREDVSTMSDAELADHVRRAMDHFLTVGPIHFELHTTWSIAGGLAMLALSEWDIGAADVAPLLAGASPASAAARRHVDRLVAGMHGQVPSSLADIRAAGPEGAGALDDYLEEYGWRGLDQHELRGAALVERPDILVASVRARMTGAGPSAPDVDPSDLRDRVPEADRERFDDALDRLREAYGLNDDNVGITWGWPLGLVRRGVLEAGARLAARGAIDDAEDLFEATPDEVVALLLGRGPTAAELTERSARFAAAGVLEPPPMIGESPPADDAPGRPALPEAVARLVAAEHALWASAPPSSTRPLAGIGIGDTPYVGRACVVDGDGYLDLVPGDVIVATTTHAGHNTVFPIAGAVATEHGALFSHPAVLARELGLPAVIGAAGLLERVKTGQTIEVDPIEGVVRVRD